MNQGVVRHFLPQRSQRSTEESQWSYVGSHAQPTFVSSVFQLSGDLCVRSSGNVESIVFLRRFSAYSRTVDISEGDHLFVMDCYELLAVQARRAGTSSAGAVRPRSDAIGPIQA